ncbi:CBS domain-containing protein [Streptomyces meridianus]|uniref:CBS domain-containing protein n=1 Tax=Streptomyces meridianus TaxID=2938945 RepID=A0ABT0X3Y7_9ACTN|nr:CBS domain-containing protein [Streptomyces meridianus]MCM2576514.1 CBS domain-containing protein [Streptomyces meridianus]
MARTKRMAVREIMHEGAQCVTEGQTLFDAARMMRDLDVGCVPICGDDNRLKGMITDRDIVLRCCAEGRDPAQVRAGEFAGSLWWIDADADVSKALDAMEEHKVKRLPVIDVADGHRLVGMISEANLARNLSDHELGEFVGQVYAPA